MTMKTFRLPDLGEGLEESEIVTWRVAVGDEVELNQIIAEVETAKALVEVPSPFAGRVDRLFAEAGTVVAVGAPIVAFEVVEDQAGGQVAEVEPDDPAELTESVSTVTAPKVERELMLVGYGPPVEGGRRPKRRERPHLRTVDAPPPRAAGGRPTGTAGGAPVRVEAPPPDDEGSPLAGQHDVAPRRRSTPPVRRLATELGVALADLDGTGEGGLVTRDDVMAASAASVPPSGETTDRRETRIPIRGVRKATAQAMVASAFTAPQATEFLTVDVTPTVELLTRLRAERAFSGLKLTMLTVVAKALCISAARTPEVSSRWDDGSQEIVQFGYVNLGIAVATPRGLLVPNIKDADRMSLADLAVALSALTETARAGRSTPSDLAGGTISITNIGVFGIDAGTPILTPGEAVIVAIGAVRRTPWEYRDEIALRQVMTISCSFDHRLVDGEQASRFLADVGRILADPGMLMTMV